MYQIQKIKMEDGNLAVPARERVRFANEELKLDYDHHTYFTPLAEGRYVQCTCIVTVFINGNGRRRTGTSVRQVNWINYNYAFETTETIATGRAFAAHGIGIDESYASADEIQDAKLPATITASPEAAQKGAEAVQAVADVIQNTMGAKKEYTNPRKRVEKPASDLKLPSETRAEPVDDSINGEQLPTRPEESQETAVEDVKEGKAPTIDPLPAGFEEKQTEGEPDPPAPAPTPVQPIPVAKAKEKAESKASGNPLNIAVEGIPEGSTQRKFKNFYDMYNSLLALCTGKDKHAEFEKLVKEVIDECTYADAYANVKDESGKRNIPTYEVLLKRAPVEIVDEFLCDFYDKVKK